MAAEERHWLRNTSECGNSSKLSPNMFIPMRAIPISGAFMCFIKATGARALIKWIFALYSGLLEAITKNEVVPWE